jgi:predicted membrane protein
MAAQITSKKRAKAISLALLLVGLAIISWLKFWWPGIMLVIGLPLALRQYLMGRHYDMAVSLFVFLGVFVTVQFDISWEVLLPVLFTVGGIYVFFREYLENKMAPEDEQEEDINHEIEEDKK